MKLVALFTLLVVAVSALPIEDERVSGENGWYVPQHDGSLEWVTLEEGEALLKKAERKEHLRLFSGAVKFYLLTKSNPTLARAQNIKTDDDSIAASNFNPKNPTRFIIHGWNSNWQTGLTTSIAYAWFSHGDHNIIAVDWDRARSLEYASSVVGVAKAGAKVAEMIDHLHKNFAMSFDTLHVIGHSLGAHVSGYTGKNVKLGQIHTIIGLDPALPLFSHDNTNKRLAATDAHYVESITTNGGGLGFLKPIGKGAFYPNGGKSQPGCGWDLTGGCAHGRSVEYYAEALHMDNFASMKCESYKDAVKKNCGQTYGKVRMGAMTNFLTASGEFYVPINEKSPYGMLEQK